MRGRPGGALSDALRPHGVFIQAHEPASSAAISGGEAGPFLAEGHTRPGGSLPVNTNGGQLSESYTHNWMHLYEAVRQRRIG